MRCAYFDCFSGAAGDMLLAALLDAGWDLADLKKIVEKLNLPGVSILAEKVKRQGIAATYVKVEVAPEARAKHRHLPQIVKIIDAAGLPPRVAERAKKIFTRLAEAEAQVHATTVEKVHFHEVGANDAIVDIVCVCAGLEALGAEQILCSPIPTGHGTVTCEHGIMPVPAPATANLLKNIPLAACDEPGELITPTGAAILTTLAQSFGPPPALRMTAIGYGAGTREGQTRPNILRLILGETETAVSDEIDLITVLEAQIDDAPGQTLAYAAERLLEAGALDTFLVPIMMKKGRPGQLLTVLCRPADVAAMETVLFCETTTFGVRRRETLRSKLAREHVTVETRFGPIRVKLGRRGGQTLQAWPEYEDCAAAARQKNVALRAVQQEALRIWAQTRAPENV